eukprot:CAMPEP_0204506604 /NCGR_PEP_ID=MMETSP0471-20130131/109335_1 /ASSEMBLY_ACC=CAM_ASM_000602 /TAXON_ID=2969 /ORGANISM="Oxyrrhis marina" /LENGTH=665 /DNA_ID=CAMNT_0051511611 /DNA_START=91 /DNA_END=2089 /DNA_ORIENTATION=+
MRVLAAFWTVSASAGTCEHSNADLVAVCRGCTSDQCLSAAQWGCSWKSSGASFLAAAKSDRCVAAALRKDTGPSQPCGRELITGAQGTCDAATAGWVCGALSSSGICSGAPAAELQVVRGSRVQLVQVPPINRRLPTTTTTIYPPGTRLYPEGGVALPNGDAPDPCDKDERLVTNANGRKVCFPMGRSLVLQGCIAQLECPKGYACREADSDQGGLCVYADDMVSPSILEATCLHDSDCGEDRVCRDAGFGTNACVIKGNETIPCVGHHECPDDLSCRGGQDVVDNDGTVVGRNRDGAICVAAPERPVYIEAKEARERMQLLQRAGNGTEAGLVNGMNVSEAWVPKDWHTRKVAPTVVERPASDAPTMTVNGMVVSASWIPALLQRSVNGTEAGLVNGMNVSEAWVPKDWHTRKVAPKVSENPVPEAPTMTVNGMVVSASWIPSAFLQRSDNGTEAGLVNGMNVSEAWVPKDWHTRKVAPKVSENPVPEAPTMTVNGMVVSASWIPALLQRSVNGTEAGLVNGMNVSEAWVPKDWHTRKVRPQVSERPVSEAPTMTVNGMVVSASWIPPTLVQEPNSTVDAGKVNGMEVSTAWVPKEWKVPEVVHPVIDENPEPAAPAATVNGMEVSASWIPSALAQVAPTTSSLRGEVLIASKGKVPLFAQGIG